jgi:chromosome segregation ATPase
VRLLKLTLNNFKGIRHFELDTMGRDVAVFGDNATGKSTLADAAQWLLFDKDSQNKKDFAIKTLDENNQVIPGLDHSVEGVFEIGGNNHSLKKVYSEVWTKKRGSTTKEMTGNTTDYFIDGVPAQKKEYDAFIAGITNESVFKLLTSPTYFNEQLHWQERRKILLEVCGDISDAEVIDSNMELVNLTEILNSRSLDNHRKVIAARRTEINKELEKLPVRIDEASKGLPDVTGLSMDKLRDDIDILRYKEQEKLAELSRIQTGGEVAEKRKRLRELESELMDLQNEQRRQFDIAIGSLERDARKIENDISDLNVFVREKSIKSKMNTAAIRTMEADIEKLRKKWAEVNNTVFFFNQDDTCPTCGQALPEERLTAAREKALADFNREKAEELTNISAKGKTIKAEMETVVESNSKLEKEIRELELAVNEKAEAVQAIRDKIAEIDRQQQPVNPEITKKLEEISALKTDILFLQSGTQEVAKKVQQEIKELELAIKEKQASQVDIDTYNRGQIRIRELMDQEKELAKEFEQLEQELYLCEQFIKTKVKMLDEKINSRFEYAKFKLFETQVNGGISEVCETTYQGVPYSSGLNNAARINVGLDIINTLAEHYDFDAPIFVDNAEAVTKLIETRGQIIKLVVSEFDKKLRVEVA